MHRVFGENGPLMIDGSGLINDGNITTRSEYYLHLRQYVQTILYSTSFPYGTSSHRRRSSSQRVTPSTTSSSSSRIHASDRSQSRELASSRNESPDHAAAHEIYYVVQSARVGWDTLHLCGKEKIN